MSETIARPQIHPSFREMVQARRAETFALQTWTPACCHCGERAERALPVDEARAWWAAHQDDCVARRMAA
jgi:hypothetical protein